MEKDEEEEEEGRRNRREREKEKRKQEDLDDYEEVEIGRFCERKIKGRNNGRGKGERIKG